MNMDSYWQNKTKQKREKQEQTKPSREMKQN